MIEASYLSKLYRAPEMSVSLNSELTPVTRRRRSARPRRRRMARTLHIDGTASREQSTLEARSAVTLRFQGLHGNRLERDHTSWGRGSTRSARSNDRVTATMTTGDALQRTHSLSRVKSDVRLNPGGIRELRPISHGKKRDLPSVVMV